MIKKLRIKFLIITMSIILAVFAIFFGVTCFFFNVSFNQNTQNELNHIAENYTQKKGLDPKSLILIYQNNTGILISTISIQNKFDDSVIEEIENKNKTSKSPLKNVDTIYFIEKTLDNNTLIIAIDAEESLDVLKSQKNSVLLTLFGLFVVLFIIVFSVSYQIFKPIEETFIKQKQFISDASHELKTPIAIISANSDVLENSIDSKYLDSVKSQTKRLKSLVDDMLTLSRIDEGTITLSKTTFSLSKELELLVLPFEAVAFESQKNLNIDIKSDIEYTGDLESIKKLTYVLLDNAIKHSSPNGTINVILKKEGLKPHLIVQNTGSDILPEDEDKLFERFYRGDSSRSRKTGGSGLGLAIAKSIVELNKWKISAKSIKDESMTITVIL